jgi:predicted ATPase/class 3 adenylate cyclase
LVDNALSSPVPSGPVTFLFSDIERSTQSLVLVGDERYAELLQDHRTLLRSAFTEHEGIEFATEGDALFFAFTRASNAMEAALAGQRSIQEHSWPEEFPVRVRIGLHTGEAVFSQGEYVGHNVHKAKRICDAGHGGQILVSDTTAPLLLPDLPAEASLTDLGPHRLKDLGDAQHLYQLTDEDLRADFPPLRTLESFTHNLPQQRSTFIGREREIADVRKLLELHNLVTLAGIGGTGKTRLALQVGAEEIDQYPDGVFLVELAALSDQSQIARAVADALGMMIGGGLTGSTPVPIVDLVVDHLARRRSLIILDNCEHLIDGCADLVDRVLAHCPNVTILATSRETIGVEGEQAWRVPSMTVADDVIEAEQSESVRLFCIRAQAVQPGFELTADNVTIVRDICARLDGIPLAIELAASRVSHLSPQQIAHRLGDMFRLLTGARRRVQRQQTLEASLDWSYDLLNDDERALLRRLSVFSGSFSLDAAEAICATNGFVLGSVVDLLGSLVAKSLVLAAEKGAETRYRLLEPVRLYAAEHLARAGESEALRARHRDHYLSWLESFPPDEATFGFAAFQAFVGEHDNLRAAIQWSIAQGEYDLVGRMANRLLTLSWNGGYSDEAHEWLTAAVEHANLSDQDLVAAYAGLAACSILRVSADARDYAAKAIEVAAGRPFPHQVIARSLGAVFTGVVAEMARDEDAIAETRAWAKKAVTIGAQAGPAWEAFALVIAGQVELILRQVETADRYLQAALETWRVPSISVIGCASALAVTRHILGDPEGALAAARTASEMEKLGGQPGLGANSLALALAGVGDEHGANEQLRTSIRNALKWGVSLWLNEALVFCGAVAAIRGDPARASRLFAAGRYLGDAPNMATPFRTGGSYALYLHYSPRVRQALHRDIVRETRMEGKAMSIDDAMAYALEGLDA